MTPNLCEVASALMQCSATLRAVRDGREIKGYVLDPTVAEQCLWSIAERDWPEAITARAKRHLAELGLIKFGAVT